MDYDLSIVILSYNTVDLLRICLQSVQRAVHHLAVEVFVVDNNSQDGSAQMVADEFPDVVLLPNQQNVGYAKGNNQALRLCTGRSILLLNPDTEVGEDVLVRTLQYLTEHEDVGVLTCKVLKPDGKLDLACRRSFPTPWIALCRFVGLAQLFPSSRLFAQYNLTYLDEDETYEVDAVMGAFMLIRREAFLEVGYLDESFFMYGEDLDWCYRFRQIGYKIMYYPEVAILHHKGASSQNRRPVRMVREFHRAMLLFLRKYLERDTFFLAKWFYRFGVFIHLVFNLTLSRIDSMVNNQK